MEGWPLWRLCDAEMGDFRQSLGAKRFPPNGRPAVFRRRAMGHKGHAPEKCMRFSDKNMPIIKELDHCM